MAAFDGFRSVFGTAVGTAIAAASFAFMVHSENVVKTKSYSLFNPVPPSEMREMSTDRPDATESPYTVDAGHFQIEMTMYGRAELRADWLPSSQWVVETFGDLNLKLGLLDGLDLQALITLHELETSHEEHPYGPQYGVSDYRRSRNFRELTLRAKFNLVGNDGGKVAIGFMPFARVPVGQEGDDRAFGAIVPVAFDFSPLSLGMMAQAWNARSAVNTWNGRIAYEWNGMGTTVLGLELTDRLGMYAEGICELELGSGSDVSFTVSSGMTFGVTEDVQLDLGLLQGLEEDVDEFSYFFGLSVRR